MCFAREFLSAGVPDFCENILKIYLRRFTAAAAAREGFTVDKNPAPTIPKWLLHFSQSLAISLFCPHSTPPFLWRRSRGGVFFVFLFFFHVSFSVRHNRHGAFGSLGLDFQIKPGADGGAAALSVLQGVARQHGQSLLLSISRREEKKKKMRKKVDAEKKDKPQVASTLLLSLEALRLLNTVYRLPLGPLRSRLNG